MYTEKTAAARAETQPACGEGTGQLPACGALAFPYVAMQGTDPVRYDDQEALRQGTLFPGLDLPFHKELRSRFPQVDGPLLELMALNPNKVYSREKLLNLVWGADYPGDVRTVDVHIRRLREKIETNPSEPRYVHTKWGVGDFFRV